MAPALTLDALRQAIEQIRPELPGLVGTEYPTFAAQLNSNLSAGSINRVLDLFRQHGAAHQRLLAVLPNRTENQTKSLFGNLPDPIGVQLPFLYYVCPVGPHLVRVKRVEEQDAAGRALCSVDHVVMKRVNPNDLRTAVEAVGPELPQLIGPEYPDFVSKLNTSLAAASQDPAWALLIQHSALYQRLLQVLISG